MLARFEGGGGAPLLTGCSGPAALAEGGKGGDPPAEPPAAGDRIDGGRGGATAGPGPAAPGGVGPAEGGGGGPLRGGAAPGDIDGGRGGVRPDFGAGGALSRLGTMSSNTLRSDPSFSPIQFLQCARQGRVPDGNTPNTYAAWGTCQLSRLESRPA
jgi:hypothetical protein